MDFQINRDNAHVQNIREQKNYLNKIGRASCRERV